MKNELLHIGPLTVYGYGFMIAMGVLAAWFVTEQRARRLHLAYEHIFYLEQKIMEHCHWQYSIMQNRRSWQMCRQTVLCQDRK